MVALLALRCILRRLLLLSVSRILDQSVAVLSQQDCTQFQVKCGFNKSALLQSYAVFSSLGANSLWRCSSATFEAAQSVSRTILFDKNMQELLSLAR